MQFGVGDFKNSYAYDGHRCLKWNKGSKAYGQASSKRHSSAEVLGKCFPILLFLSIGKLAMSSQCCWTSTRAALHSAGTVRPILPEILIQFEERKHSTSDACSYLKNILIFAGFDLGIAY